MNETRYTVYMPQKKRNWKEMDKRNANNLTESEVFFPVLWLEKGIEPP